MQYIVLDDEHITVWEFKDIKVDDSGCVSKIWDQSLNMGEGMYRNIDKEKDIASPVSIAHGRGKCPIVRYEISDSLYMTDQVADAQRLIYGLMMNLIHTARNSGFVQKWGEPYGLGISGSREAGGVSFMPMPQQAVNAALSEISKLMGDESFLFMNKFAFEEIQGTSVDTLMKIIDSLKMYIFTSILFNDSQFEKGDGAVDPQSGRSKEIDFYIQNQALKKHGSTLIEFATKLLQGISRAFGITQRKQLRSISVSGMDKFDILPLDISLGLVERLFKLPKEALPSELLSEAMIQLSRLILTNDTYEYKNQLDDAILKKVDEYLAIPSELAIKASAIGQATS
jgi:hypothetical protein